MEWNGPAWHAHVELEDTDCPLNDNAGDEDPAGLLRGIGSIFAVEHYLHDDGEQDVDVHASGVDVGHELGVDIQTTFHTNTRVAGVYTRTSDHGAGHQHDAKPYYGSDGEVANGIGKLWRARAIVGFFNACVQHGGNPDQAHRWNEVDGNRPPVQIHKGGDGDAVGLLGD